MIEQEVQRRRVPVRILSVLSALTVSAGFVHAQEASESDDAIEELLVVGTQLEETIPLDLREYGNHVEVISAAEIELAGFNDLSLVHVGDIYDSVSGGIGRVEHGNYTVLDLGAAYYLGDDRSHRLNVRLENALDEDYAASLGRAFMDSDGSSYAYRNLGTPRTIKLAYTYRF